MHRRIRIAASLVPVIALVGCTAAPVDESALTEWLETQTVDTADDLLAQASARVSAGADAGEGVRMDFASAARVDQIVVSCFGDARMRIAITLRTASGASTVHVTDEHECATGALTVDPADYGDSMLLSVAVDGFASTRDSAWSAFVIGDSDD